MMGTCWRPACPVAHSNVRNAPQHARSCNFGTFSVSRMPNASKDEAECSVADITVVLYPCRIALVGAMPAATRASWRLVNERARDDVFDACTRLRWREPAMRRHNVLLKRVTLQSQPQPRLLPVALMAKLPVLRQLLCHDLDTLTTLEGLPAGLDVLDLSGTATCSINDFAAMAGCSRLLVLDLHDGSLGSAKALQVATQGMHGLSCLRDLNLAECYLGPGGEASKCIAFLHALRKMLLSSACCTRRTLQGNSSRLACVLC